MLEKVIMFLKENLRGLIKYLYRNLIYYKNCPCGISNRNIKCSSIGKALRNLAALLFRKLKVAILSTCLTTLVKCLGCKIAKTAARVSDMILDGLIFALYGTLLT